ncbi:MAG TPA: methyltransferase domain-containing protein [Dermatophilaceae bacterium]|nr:methyltransferase domain-containing protein [Dermatophilaceae bacterium]
MRRRTKVALIAGGTSAVVAGARFVRGRSGERGTEKALPDEGAVFTAFAPGGPQAFWCNGPVGWLTSRIIPIAEAGVYRTVADMLDLRPDDELLDIGCGPGGFVAAKAQHVGRVVGLDTSPLMLRAAERRLADRIAACTAELVLGNAAALPFGDGTFSVATAVYAPASAAEVFRVLRPGGRFVAADPDPARTPTENAGASYGRRKWGEADYRSMFEDAGFTDLVIRFGRGGLFVRCRKPTASNPSTALDPDSQQGPGGGAEIA